MKDIWVPVSGQIAQQQKIDSIANNLANINTNGFKRDDVVFKEYLTALEGPLPDINLPRKEFAPKDFYHSHGHENAKVKIDGTYTEFTQGALSYTGNPFDLALKGKGFFEVLTPRGVRYSRASTFSFNQRGELVDSNGNYILGQSQDGGGDPSSRKIALSNLSQVIVNQQGEIVAGEDTLGKISVVEFKDINALRKEGQGLYVNQYPDNPLTQAQTTVHQGYVERSNVNAIKEMANLLQAHRQFESIQKAIQTYDKINDVMVNKIPRF